MRELGKNVGGKSENDKKKLKRKQKREGKMKINRSGEIFIFFLSY